MGLEARTRRASPRARGVRTTVGERRPSIAARVEGERSTRVSGRPSTRELHAARRAAVPNCIRRRVRERGRGGAGLGRRTHTRRAPKDGALLSQPGPRRRVRQKRGKKGTRSRELGTPRRPSRKIRDTRPPCPKGHFETAVSFQPSPKFRLVLTRATFCRCARASTACPAAAARAASSRRPIFAVNLSTGRAFTLCFA